MVAPCLLKEIEGISFLGFHQKHKVGVCQQIEDVDEGGHRGKECQAFRELLEGGLDLSRNGQHQGVKRQKDMYREGVPMHEICKGELCPRGKKEGEDRTGNADGVKKIAKGLPRLKDVDRDQKNVDTAKVEGEIVDVVVSEGGENNDLQYLVQNDQTCHGKAETATACVFAFGIEIATDRRNQNKG